MKTVKRTIPHCTCSDSYPTRVHSHITHIYGLLELAKRNGLDKVFVHCFLDGRDTPPASGKDFVAALEEKMQELGVGKVASVMGRYYAMDRDNRWDRVELAYKALTAGEGNKGTSATELIQASYDDGKTDEFVVPAVVTGEDGMRSERSGQRFRDLLQLPPGPCKRDDPRVLR